nr:MAG TPA: Colipase-like protein [Caudoviricetes sp.]
MRISTQFPRTQQHEESIPGAHCQLHPECQKTCCIA